MYQPDRNLREPQLPRRVLESRTDVNGIFATLHTDLTPGSTSTASKALRLYESRSSNILTIRVLSTLLSCPNRIGVPRNLLFATHCLVRLDQQKVNPAVGDFARQSQCGFAFLGSFSQCTFLQ